MFSAMRDLGEDEVCNENSDSAFGLLCDPPLVCDICPEGSGNTTCQLPSQGDILH